METVQEVTPDTAQAPAYLAERLRKLADVASPETNIYANDKRVLYFKNRSLDLWGRLQLDAPLASELFYAGQSEEAIQLFNRIRVTLSANRLGFVPHLIATTEEYLALFYLRLGEQHNTHLC